MSKRTSKRSRKRTSTVFPLEENVRQVAVVKAKDDHVRNITTKSDEGLKEDLRKKFKLTEEDNDPLVDVEMKNPSDIGCSEQLEGTGSNTPLAEKPEDNVKPSDEDSAAAVKIVPAFVKKLSLYRKGKQNSGTKNNGKSKGQLDIPIEEKKGQKGQSDSSKDDEQNVTKCDVDVCPGGVGDVVENPLGKDLVSRLEAEGDIGKKGSGSRGLETSGLAVTPSVNSQELGKPGKADRCNEAECEKTALASSTGDNREGGYVQVVGERLEAAEGTISHPETAEHKSEAGNKTESTPQNAEVEAGREDGRAKALNDNDGVGCEGEKSRLEADSGVTETVNAVADQSASHEVAASILSQPGGTPGGHKGAGGAEHTGAPPSRTGSEVIPDAREEREENDSHAARGNMSELTPPKPDEAGMSDDKVPPSEGDRDKDAGTWEAPGCQDMDFTFSQLQKIEDMELELMGNTRTTDGPSQEGNPLLKERCGLVAVKKAAMPAGGHSGGPVPLPPPPNRPISAVRARDRPTEEERATAQREAEERVENERVKGAMKNMMKDLNDIKLMAGSLLSQMTHYRKHRSQRQPQPSAFLGKKSAPLLFPCQPKGSSTSQFKKF